MGSLKELKEKSLSSLEIVKALNNKVTLLTYPELNDIKTLDQILKKGGQAVILYQTSDDYGHWICLYKDPLVKNRVSFFDPLGYKPDAELKFIPEHFRKVSGQQLPLLSALLLESGYEVEYNQYKVQKDNTSVSTCGRHCIVRLQNKNVPLDQYVKVLNSFKPKYTPDDIVTILTASI